MGTVLPGSNLTLITQIKYNKVAWYFYSYGSRHAVCNYLGKEREGESDGNAQNTQHAAVSAGTDSS